MACTAGGGEDSMLSSSSTMKLDIDTTSSSTMTQSSSSSVNRLITSRSACEPGVLGRQRRLRVLDSSPSSDLVMYSRRRLRYPAPSPTGGESDWDSGVEGGLEGSKIDAKVAGRAWTSSSDVWMLTA